MVSEPSLNLEDVFKKVFSLALHDKDSIDYYKVVIPKVYEKPQIPTERLYFQGKRTNPYAHSFGWHGHSFYVIDEYNPDEINDYGYCYVRPAPGYPPILILFKERLYGEEQSERASDPVVEVADSESEQL